MVNLLQPKEKERKINLMLKGIAFLLAFQLIIHHINWERNLSKVPAVAC